MLYEKEENALIEFLAVVYAIIPWGKIRTSKNPHDIFNHRVRAASRRGNIYQFASKLCNYFGLQTLPKNSIKSLDILRANEITVLNILSAEHIPYCVRGIMRAKEIKELKKKSKEEDIDVSSTDTKI